jgi:hypothetical protein
MIKIRCVKDGFDNFLYLDREWLEKGNVIYYFGKTPVTITGKVVTCGGSPTFVCYTTKEFTSTKCGNWFTLEPIKNEKITEDEKTTNTIVINISIELKCSR